MTDTKNVQIRMSPNMHNGLSKIAKDENSTVSDTIRKALETYAILYKIRLDHKRIAVIDSLGRAEMEIMIPGVTSSLENFLIESPNTNNTTRA